MVDIVNASAKPLLALLSTGWAEIRPPVSGTANCKWRFVSSQFALRAEYFPIADASLVVSAPTTIKSAQAGLPSLGRFFVADALRKGI